MSGGGTCRPWERRASPPGPGGPARGAGAAGGGGPPPPPPPPPPRAPPRKTPPTRREWAPTRCTRRLVTQLPHGKSSLKVGVDGWSVRTASDRTSAAFVLILVFWRIVSVAAVDGRRATRDRGPREPPAVSRGHSRPREPAHET